VEKSSSKSKKVISGNSGNKDEEIRQWQPPQMGPSISGVAARSLLTAEQLEQIQKQAYEEGFVQGKREGFEFGHREALSSGKTALRERLDRLDAIVRTLEAPLKQLDDRMEREIVDLVIAIVRQLVRREVKTDPAQIIGVVREALAVLPISSRNVRVVLHHDDAELLRETYDVSEKELGWSIVEDPIMERGGCKVVTEVSQVDATLESRLTALITQMLGGERNEDLTSSEPEV
jgi:flagellar assembly protein FliH